MIELTEGMGYIALESALDGDKFLVNGREMELGVRTNRGIYLWCRDESGDPDAGFYVRRGVHGVGLYTVRQMQGMMMSGFFEVCR